MSFAPKRKYGQINRKNVEHKVVFLNYQSENLQKRILYLVSQRLMLPVNIKCKTRLCDSCIVQVPEPKMNRTTKKEKAELKTSRTQNKHASIRQEKMNTYFSHRRISDCYNTCRSMKKYYSTKELVIESSYYKQSQLVARNKYSLIQSLFYSPGKRRFDSPDKFLSTKTSINKYYSVQVEIPYSESKYLHKRASMSSKDVETLLRIIVMQAESLSKYI